MFFVKRFVIIALAAAFLVACEDRDNPTPAPPGEGRTVLVYMAANTNLNSDAFVDINEMESVWDDGNNGHLYVMYNTTGNRNTLYKIRRDTDPKVINSQIVKEYPTTNNPCDAEFLKTVVQDVRELSPAKSYGLFLWAHGSGWLPQGSYSPLKVGSNPQSKLGVDEVNHSGEIQAQTTVSSDTPAGYSFGSTYNSQTQMEIYDIARTLSGLHFDFLYFDACHMASVEAIYQLRGVADYIISSSAETFTTGAAYNEITPMMFEANPQALSISMAKSFYNFYNHPSRSAFFRSGTISVVKTAALPALASAVKNLVTPQIKPIPIAKIQEFGRDMGGAADFSDIFFDLTDFITQTWGVNANFNAAMADAVPYQAATENLFSEIKVLTHCGMTAYVPNSAQTRTLNIYRTKYDWATDSGLGTVVK